MKIVMSLVIGGSMLALSVPAANAAGVCSTTTPQYCPAPVVITGPATTVTTSSAVLNGTVNPNGAVTTCAFSYAVGAAPATTTPAQTIAAGTSPVPVTAQLTALAAKTTYAYNLICISGGGFGAGSAMTFTTLGRSRIALIRNNGKVSKKRILTVRLKCIGGTTCKGTVTLRAKANGKGKKLASKTFRIRSNKRGSVLLKVSKKIFNQIKHPHFLKAKIIAKETGGNTVSQTIKLHR